MHVLSCFIQLKKHSFNLLCVLDLVDVGYQKHNKNFLKSQITVCTYYHMLFDEMCVKSCHLFNNKFVIKGAKVEIKVTVQLTADWSAPIK